MVTRVNVLVVVLAASLLSGDAAAKEPSEIDLLYGRLRPDGLTPELEDACFSAQESGAPAPWLFGVELTRRTFVVSLFAARGRLTLGTMAYRQDALPYPDDTVEI